MEQIVLSVPFAEKDNAKAAGAKWNSGLKTWYIERRRGDSGYGLPELAKWTCPNDKRFLECPAEHDEIAEARGAIRDQTTGRLFVPSWFAAAGRTGEILYRLAYWLPSCPEFCRPGHNAFKAEFANHAKAALFIAVNAPYTRIDLYLPEERAAMD